MGKIYSALGLMSGTSMDGVDLSIIQTDGKTKYKVILDQYFAYPNSIYNKLAVLRDKINVSKDLTKHQKKLKFVEKEITIFHAKAVNEVLKKSMTSIDFIGFHGQTIFHSAKKKITKQLGDGKLLSKLTKQKVIYDFRKNDLKNGGEGAPLTPIFHKMLENKFNIKPVSFFNIGGIVNRTTICNDGKLSAKDVGPGMCLIDKWIRINSKKKYDKNGNIAKSGKVNKKVLNEYWDKFLIFSSDKKSYDTSDFDISFFKGLSFEDGTATLTHHTANIFITLIKNNKILKIKENLILSGGGRKNKFLVDKIRSYKKNIKLIDDYGIDGDFIESQAFAYLAIRSYLKLPISFPNTTGCKKPCTGGIMVKNF